MKAVLILLTAFIVFALAWRFVARRIRNNGKGAAVSHLSGLAAGFLSGVIFLFVAAMIDGPTPTTASSSVPASTTAQAASSPASSTEASQSTKEEPAPSNSGRDAEAPGVHYVADGDLTGPQSNAVRSAKQYLSMEGFSRKGLIGQLSSDAGEGYEIADATAAVDSLNVDWNQQAVRSAKQYLSMQGFSCKGLIEQLSSSAGEGYTVKQATYGAKQAGAC